MVHMVVVDVVVVHNAGGSLSPVVGVAGVMVVISRGVGETSVGVEMWPKFVVTASGVGAGVRGMGLEFEVAVGTMVTWTGGTSDSFSESCEGWTLSVSLAQL